MYDKANVSLMEHEDGHRYILVEDHPMPPTNCIQWFGTFDIPQSWGWGEAKTIAEAKAKELNVPIEYHSDFIESYLASCEDM